MKTLTTLLCSAMLFMPVALYADCGSCGDSKKCTCEEDCKACDGSKDCTCDECKCDGCKNHKEDDHDHDHK